MLVSGFEFRDKPCRGGEGEKVVVVGSCSCRKELSHLEESAIAGRMKSTCEWVCGNGAMPEWVERAWQRLSETEIMRMGIVHKMNRRVAPPVPLRGSNSMATKKKCSLCRLHFGVCVEMAYAVSASFKRTILQFCQLVTECIDLANIVAAMVRPLRLDWQFAACLM